MRRLLITLLMILVCPTIALAGWEQDEIGWKFKNENGSYQIGWYQDADNKWYYLDNTTEYMLVDTVTPDGLYVSKSGEWVENIVQDAKTDGYDYKTELKIRGISNTTKTRDFGYEIPTTIFYNNTYSNPGGGMISVESVEVTKEGAPFLKIYASGVRNEMFDISQEIKYTFFDGVVVEKSKSSPTIMNKEEFEASIALMNVLGIDREFTDKQVISIEIRINEAKN